MKISNLVLTLRTSCWHSGITSQGAERERTTLKFGILSYLRKLVVSYLAIQPSCLNRSNIGTSRSRSMQVVFRQRFFPQFRHYSLAHIAEKIRFIIINGIDVSDQGSDNMPLLRRAGALCAYPGVALAAGIKTLPH